MANIKILPIILIVLSLALLGCVGRPPAGTSVPTATPTETPTVIPTPIPTTPAPTLTPRTSPPVNYTIWVDSDYGFYRIKAAIGNSSIQLPTNFNILNFSINVGDKIKWINDDSYGFPLTIVSDDGLWTGRTGYLRYPGDQFEYTFNKTGTYTFSIKEYPRTNKQRVTVNP